MFKFVLESDRNEFVGFSVGENDYCVNIQNVEEIIMIPSISKVPNVPSYVEGAINLRGKIIQIINLHKWFKSTWKPFSIDSRIIILKFKDEYIGILIDSVHQVFRTEKDKQHNIPEIIEQKLSIPYLRSVIVWNQNLFLEINPEIIYSKLK